MEINIAAFAAIAGGAVAVILTTFSILIMRFINTQEKSIKILENSISDRVFYSKYSDQREDLERKIAEIQRRLSQTQSGFLDTNHLIADAQNKPLSTNNKNIDPVSFLETLGINIENLSIDPKTIFVLTPFHDDESFVFSSIVDTFKPLGIRVIRGDEHLAKGDILSHVVKQMLSSKFVIANVSSRNPNVMYELGIAHSLGKDVIVISGTTENIPFDISSRRILFFKNHFDLSEKLVTEVAKKMFS